MRYAPVMALMALLLATTASPARIPGDPSSAREGIVLRAVHRLPAGGLPGKPATVNINPGAAAIFLFVMNYNAWRRADGLPADASWTFAFASGLPGGS